MSNNYNNNNVQLQQSDRSINNLDEKHNSNDNSVSVSAQILKLTKSDPQLIFDIVQPANEI